MYKKVISHFDYKHFGSRISVYESKDNYLLIIDGRDGRVFYFIDLALKNMYPVNDYMKKINFEFIDHFEKEELNYKFPIDLQKHGFSQCPEWVVSLISGTGK